MKRLTVLLGLLLPVAAWAAENTFHPPFPLLDADGREVMVSGAPMDEMRSCGGCHDTEFIKASSDHMAAEVFEDGAYRCLTCHSEFEPPQDWSSLPFAAEGSLDASVLDVHKPRDSNCATCHAVVNDLPLGRNIDEALRMLDALQFTEKHGDVCPANWKEGEEAMKPTAEGVAAYLAKHGQDIA